MELLNRIKKLASILLLICLFLPLSQCTESTKDGKESVTVHYGYQILVDSTIELFNEGIDWGKIISIFVYFSFFFAPLLILKLKTPIQQIIIIILLLPSYYIIYIHVATYTPRVGIWLSAVLWTIIAIANLIELYNHIKQRNQNKAQDTGNSNVG